MSERVIIPVAAFAPQGDEADKLLAYPFARPTNSHITDGEMVTILPDDLHTFTAAANAYLRVRGLPLMEDRIAVVEFGSNSSPHQMREKMKQYGSEEFQPEMQTIPKLFGVLRDTEIAWHGKPAQRGSAFAEAYKGDETVGQEAVCTIGFYGEKQLAVVHASEGVTYQVALIDVLGGSDRRPLKAYAYVATDSVVLFKDGKPVPVKWSKEASKETAMTAGEAVDFMLQQAGETIGIKTVRELIDRAADEDLEGRKTLQQLIAQLLHKQVLSRDYSYPKEKDNVIARADFNSFRTPHPETLRLMEEVVQPLRPSHEAIAFLANKLVDQGAKPELALKKARAKLDVAQVLRGRAFVELRNRTGLQEVKTK